MVGIIKPENSRNSSQSCLWPNTLFYVKSFIKACWCSSSSLSLWKLRIEEILDCEHLPVLSQPFFWGFISCDIKLWPGENHTTRVRGWRNSWKTHILWSYHVMDADSRQTEGLKLHRVQRIWQIHEEISATGLCLECHVVPHIQVIRYLVA